MKKVFVHFCAGFNVGDDLFLEILLKRFPAVQFYIENRDDYDCFFKVNRNLHYYENKKNIQDTTGGDSYRKSIKKALSFMLPSYLDKCIISLIRRIKAKCGMDIDYSKFDCVIFIGGSIYGNDVSFLKKKNEEEKVFNYYNDRLALIRRYNIPTYIIGSNFNSNMSQTIIDKYKTLFKQNTNIKDLCFRDKFSYNLFKENNIVRVANDVIFNLKYVKRQAKEAALGVSLIDLTNRPTKNNMVSYMSNLNNICQSAFKSGYKIKIFSFCNKEGDSQAARELAIDLRDNNCNCEIIEYNGDIYSFLDSYASCSAIIATRFHAMILSILFQIPFIPYIYNDKMINVLTDLNLASQLWTMDIREDALLNQIEIEKMLNYFLTFKKISIEHIVNNANLQFLKLDSDLNI